MPPRNHVTGSRARLVRGLVLTVFLAGVVLVTRVALSDGPAAAQDIDRALDGVFTENGVDRARLTARSSQGADGATVVTELIVSLPADETYSRLNAALTRAIEKAGGSVLDAVESGRNPERPAALDVEVGRPGEVTHRIHIEPEPPLTREERERPLARVAVVFDDLGYTMNGLAGELLEMKGPLTFAILPGLAHSEDFAEAARARGHEVILHLPMEPMNAHIHDPGPGALRTGLDVEENLRRLRKQLDAFPSYVGVSNHMGSRATSDPELVDLVLEEMYRRDKSLFFLDSRTTPHSVVPDRARRLGIRCAKNNLFLDSNDEEGIVAIAQTDRLRWIAKKYGQAIAIGHVRSETVDAIRASVSEWREQGIRLVPLSDLMHR